MLMGGCLPSMVSELIRSRSKHAGGREHVPRLHPMRSMSLIALFRRSPLNERDAKGCGLRARRCCISSQVSQAVRKSFTVQTASAACLPCRGGAPPCSETSNQKTVSRLKGLKRQVPTFV